MIKAVFIGRCRVGRWGLQFGGMVGSTGTAQAGQSSQPASQPY